jgi:hypothetical protein
MAGPAPTSDKLAKQLFLLTMAGAAAYIGAVIIFVLL